MKTAARALLVLPTVFFGLMLLYARLDHGAYAFFGTLCLLSAAASLALAWPLRRTSRKLARACAAAGSFYFAALVVLILVACVLFLIHGPMKSMNSACAEPIAQARMV